MLSINIHISKQEVKDFPLHTLECDTRWNDMIDPNKDHQFERKKTRKK